MRYLPPAGIVCIVISLTDLVTYLHIFVALAMLIAPGMALYFAVCRWTRNVSQAEVSFGVMAGVGLSVALWPLLLLYATLTGLQFFSILPWAVLLLSVAYLAFETWARFDSALTTQAQHAGRGTQYALVALTLVALAFRLSDAEGLALPLFGDSLHHTMITTLILERGAVPSDYLPYVPVKTFTYHFGFHALAALFSHFTRTSAHYAVLLLGQVMIALAVPLAYLLNVTLFRSRLAGLFAAALTGFVSLMPAFYVNWGRYTQLAGQLLLVVALVFLVRVAREKRRRSDFTLLALCVGGLVVTHYRILIFFGLFALPLAAWLLIFNRTRWQEALVGWGRIAGASLAGLLIALPWIINLVANYIEGLTQRLGSANSDYLALYNDFNTLIVYVGRALPAVALQGVIVAIVMLIRTRPQPQEVVSVGAERIALISGEGRREPRTQESSANPDKVMSRRGAGAMALCMAAWVGLLVASLYVVPGAIGSTAIAIMLFIPLGALGGYGLGALCDLVAARMPFARNLLAAGLVVVAPLLSLGFGTARVADVGRYNYVQPGDLEAFKWVKENMPPDAKFLISSEFSYTGRAVTASDGGMWLPLLAGRNVSVPALNSWMERPIATDFFTDTRELAAYTQPFTATAELPDLNSTQFALIERGLITEPQEISDPRPLELMRELGITHVYAGSPEGWSAPRLDIEAMSRDPLYFELLYSKDGVYIFRVMGDDSSLRSSNDK